MAAIPLRQEAHPEHDRQALRERADRFRAHHRERYLATLGKLADTGRDLVAALPALFHFNHAALPGYVADAPGGLPGYTPDNLTTSALRRIAPGARMQPLRNRHDLQSVFLMGSGGSAGHTGDSDIDLWVCCDQTHHAALGPKLDALTGWAAQHDLQLQGFLVDPLFFADPDNAVHDAMLLDEFYRSGIWLAGCEPMWWFVDDADAERYAETARHLLHYRFVENAIDFGPVGQPSAASLERAASREIEAAFETPSKSLLKLALIESYLDHPEQPLLSHRYQQRIVQGVTDNTQLDTYAMLYDHLEETGGGTIGVAGARDLFVRRILPRARRFANHDNLLHRFRAWGFDDAQLDTIRHPEKASLSRTLAEYDKTISLLKRGIRCAARLNAQTARTPRERAPMRAMDPCLRPDIQPALTLRSTSSGWQLVEEEGVIMKCATYIEPLVWLSLQRFTELHLRYATPWLERAGKRLIEALARQRTVIFLNPLPSLVDDGNVLLSAQDDPLSYGGLAANLLRQASVIRSNGVEAAVNHHDAPADALAALREIAATGEPAIVAAADIEDMRLVRRVQHLLADARQAFSRRQPLEIAFGRQRALLMPPNAATGVEFSD